MPRRKARPAALRPAAVARKVDNRRDRGESAPCHLSPIHPSPARSGTSCGSARSGGSAPSCSCWCCSGPSSSSRRARRLGVLPRQRGRPGPRRRDRRRRAGGALHPRSATTTPSPQRPSRTASRRPGIDARQISTTSASTTSRSRSSTASSRRTSPTRRAASSSFKRAIPLWLQGEAPHPARDPRRAWTASTTGKLVFTDHHESHAASAFFPSPVRRGRDPHVRRRRRVGDDDLGRRRGQPRSSIEKAISFPHSLGLLYSAFTYFTGLQGQLRRVQADGPRAVRRARLRRPHQGEAHRHQAGRLVPPRTWSTSPTRPSCG